MTNEMKAKTDNKAFTIIELLIAMALVVILVAISSVIFASAVRAHRTADSTIEISRRAEVIAQQLNSDVRGLRTDAPLIFRFERDTATGLRYDQILFFANGNFKTINRYNNQTVWGNLSRIYYGHAWSGTVNSTGEPWNWVIRPDGGYRPLSVSDPGAGLLSRRAHTLTSDITLPPVGLIGATFPNPGAFTGAVDQGGFVPYWNNRLEYDQLSLAEWKNLMVVQANCQPMLLRNFWSARDNDLTGRPIIDMTNPNTLHLLLSEHISAFRVQWAYTVGDLSTNTTDDNVPVPVGAAGYFTGVRWWPSTDPAGDGSLQSDFETMGRNDFGVYFQMPGGTPLTDWCRVTPDLPESRRCRAEGGYFRQDFFPRAMKFTFTIYDAKGLFPDGKIFTQIVALD